MTFFISSQVKRNYLPNNLIFYSRGETAALILRPWNRRTEKVYSTNNNVSSRNSWWKFQVVIGQDILPDRQLRNRLAKFRSDDSLADKSRPRSSWNLDEDPLSELVAFNRGKIAQELALDLNTYQFTICHHLKRIRKVSKLGVWLPHILSEKDKEDCILI